ncbi:MAG: LysR family transcriptional regulator [Burkholderiales bacterium]|nr:MAG: LysR family transcriptional regulator [Burkholderiales bacterium]
MDRLDALAALVTIADRGSFAAAAREHRVSPQAITRAVGGLEARLGVRLFQRTTRSVRATQEGAVYIARCRRLLTELQDAERDMTGARQEPRGALVVTAPVVFGRMHVLPVVAALLRRHAGLAVRLVLADRMLQMVEEGVDIAVRLGELGDSSLKAVRVGEVRRVLVASRDYLHQHGAPVTVADLRHHAVIAFTGISTSDDWRFGKSGRASVTLQPRLVVNDAAAAISAVEAGLGIARVLSYQVAEQVAKRRMTILLPDFEPNPMPVSLLFEAQRSMAANVRAFVDEASERLRAARW